MFELLTKPAINTQGHTQQVHQIKKWVREILDLPECVTVMVYELQSTEPGGPPLETLIAILEEKAETQKMKLNKPVITIVYNDLVKLYQQLTVNHKEVSHDA